MARWALVLAVVGAWWSPAQLLDPPQCANDAAERCAPEGSGQNEYNYKVDGLNVFLEYTDSGYFKLVCPEGLNLDNSALPSFKSQLRVNKVYLENCPSSRGSYADVLEKLNVVVLDKLTLTDAGNVTAARLARLQHLLKLELVQARLEGGALQAALPRLQRLFLDRVALEPGELRRLPPALEVLSLLRMGTDVTAADLRALPRLERLVLRDAGAVRGPAGGALRDLALESPEAHLPRALVPPLQSVTAYGWADARPEPWLACSPEALDLRDARAERLPAGWLERCAALRRLRLDGAARLDSLDAAALRGARALQELRILNTALQYLPPGLLDDAPDLKLLDLSSNRLLELPGGLFAKTNSLESLNLSSNQLSKSVLESLSAVTSLVSLDLSHNDIGDSCGHVSDAVRGSSPLQYLKQLRTLRLENANISMICRDWRENMPHLETLDLANNLFEFITFADMQFYGGADVDVDLRRRGLQSLQYSQHDYSRAVRPGLPAPRARLRLAALRCDCRDYWAARALRERPAHAALEARCAAGGALAAAPDALQCAGPPPGAACAAPCACAWRPPALLRLRCASAGVRSVRAALATVTAPPAARYTWELDLAHNRIDRVDPDDLPPDINITVLDLRNNSLRSLSGEVARGLVARGALLAGNPLDCSCGAAPALAELRAGLADLAAATCRGGARLALARPACARWPAPALGAAAALLVLGALAAALWRRAGLRLRLKAALHRRGWLAAAAEADEARYDAFVSFSHGDEQFVRALAARLESGPAPYRLCLHYRDWAPGGWIPAQIAASVRASRRTVAVVSEHFLRSSWARAEFQEAHALALRSARPRLVVVLLEEPSRLPLDDRLRRYLASNTYVRWGDPWFWEKLYLALPRGRGPAAPPAVMPPATVDAPTALPDPDKSSSDRLDPDKTSSDPLDPDKTSSDPLDHDKTSSDPLDPDKTSSGPLDPDKTSSGPLDPDKTSSGTLDLDESTMVPLTPGQA